MRDTKPEIDRRYREMLMARSRAERLRMGCSMYSTARTIIIASVLERFPEASAEQIREALFLRFYDGDFSPEDKRRILDALRAGPGASTSAEAERGGVRPARERPP